MRKVYDNFYRVLVSKKKGKFYELVLKGDHGLILVVMVNVDEGTIFDYRPCYNYCYGNKEAYDECLRKAIEVLKNEKH